VTGRRRRSDDVYINILAAERASVGVCWVRDLLRVRSRPDALVELVHGSVLMLTATLRRLARQVLAGPLLLADHPASAQAQVIFAEVLEVDITAITIAYGTKKKKTKKTIKFEVTELSFCSFDQV
jgi:hypothetical protein